MKLFHWITFLVKRIDIIDILQNANSYIKEKITMAQKDSSILDKIFIFSFFRGDGQFQPLYFFVFIFSCIAICLLGLKIYIIILNIKSGNIAPDLVNSTDIATIVTFVAGILTIYNFNKSSKRKYILTSNKENTENMKGEK